MKVYHGSAISGGFKLLTLDVVRFVPDLATTPVSRTWVRFFEGLDLKLTAENVSYPSVGDGSYLMGGL